ncbi:molecular chaperone [Glaciimonas immobilis]|nr:molecular chaperone [Glaciimonas immobilis]
MLAPRPALADLMLYPTRIVFEKNQRAAQLELINNGQETATYRISVVNRRMNDVGEFAPVTSPLPGELFSDKLVRYSPRQVVLAPGRSQIVRISLRKPTDLATGEYRSHFQFDRLPDVDGVTSIDAQSNPSSNIGMSLTALIGATIPLIVRQGETSANVTLSGLTILKPEATNGFMLAMVMERSGNSSVYGDLNASFTPHGGKESVIGTVGGVAVYAPNALRRVKLSLKMPAGLALKGGNVHVTFRERPDAGGKLIAEAILEIP